MVIYLGKEKSFNQTKTGLSALQTRQSKLPLLTTTLHPPQYAVVAKKMNYFSALLGIDLEIQTLYSSRVPLAYKSHYNQKKETVWVYQGLKHE